MEGKRESRKRKWMRYELQHRIELIKDGMMQQKAELEEPMWQQMQTIFDQQRKLKQQQSQQSA